MAKPSTKARIEKFFSRQVWAVLRADFTDCKDVESIATKLSEKTQGKIDVKPLTIFKMIELGIEKGEVKEKDFFHPFGVPAPKQKQGAHLSPRKSTRVKIEEFFDKTVWEVFEEKFKKCKSVEEATERLDKLTKGKISVTPVTVLNIIKAGIESKEVSDNKFYSKWAETSGSGRRGKVSTRQRLETYTKTNIWEWFREKFVGIQDRKEACAKILRLTGGSITMGDQVLILTIERGLEAKEITEEDFFAAWAAPKRKRKSKADPNAEPKKEETRYLLTGVCKSCGHTKKLSTTTSEFRFHGSGLKSHRCPSCDLWSSYTFKGEVDGVNVTDDNPNWKDCNPHKFSKKEIWESCEPKYRKSLLINPKG